MVPLVSFIKHLIAFLHPPSSSSTRPPNLSSRSSLSHLIFARPALRWPPSIFDQCCQNLERHEGSAVKLQGVESILLNQLVKYWPKLLGELTTDSIPSLLTHG